MGWAARKNPFAREGKPRSVSDTARLKALVAACSGPEELAAYVRRTFEPQHRVATFRLMLRHAPDSWRALEPVGVRAARMRDEVLTENDGKRVVVIDTVID